MICERWDTVVVPFPFTDRNRAKRRPALVVSAMEFNAAGHSIMTMITTKNAPAWPGDMRIMHSSDAGLTTQCIVRLKFFTLDNRLIVKRLGALEVNDRRQMSEQLRRYVVDCGESA